MKSSDRTSINKIKTMNKETIAHQAMSLLQNAILDVIPRVQELYSSGAIDPEEYAPGGERLAEVLAIAAVRDILDKRINRYRNSPAILCDLDNLKDF